MDDQRQSDHQPWLLSEGGQKSQSNMEWELTSFHQSLSPATFPLQEPYLPAVSEGQLHDRRPAISSWTRSRHLAHLEPIRLSSTPLGVGTLRAWGLLVFCGCWIHTILSQDSRKHVALLGLQIKEAGLEGGRWRRCTRGQTERKGGGTAAAWDSSVLQE